MFTVRSSITTPLPRESDLRRQRLRSARLFLFPMLVVLAAVAGWPLVRTIYFGFTDASLDQPRGRPMDRLRQLFHRPVAAERGHLYDGLLVDPAWWRAVWNTVRFTVISVTLETMFGMIVALVLNAEFRGRGIVRAAVLIPWAIPTIVSAKMWAGCSTTSSASSTTCC